MGLIDIATIGELGLIIVGITMAFATTVAFIPVVRRLAFRNGWTDDPDGSRKLHDMPTPTLGGVAIAAGMAAGLLFLSAMAQLTSVVVDWPPLMVWLGAAALFAAGMYDDTRGLGFKTKFAIQILVAYGLLHAGYRVDLSALPFVGGDVYNEALFTIPLTMLWIVGIINAVNLIDGLDGLAAGISVIAFFCFAFIFSLNGNPGLTMIALVMSGALIGFLAFNFNPASIFMGDTGSLVLGYLLAVFSLSGQAHVDPVMSLLVPVVVLGLPVLDTTLSVVRRVQAKKSICAPDSDHIHHRLSRRLPTAQAVLVLYGVALCFGLAAVSMAVLSPSMGWGVLVVLGGLTTGGLGVLGYIGAGSMESGDVVRQVSVGENERTDMPVASRRRMHAIRYTTIHRDKDGAAYTNERDEDEILREVA